MKFNVTIEMDEYDLNRLTECITDNEFSSEKELIDFFTEIICDDYREFYFVKKEICEEVLRRAKEKGFSVNKK